MPTYEVDFGGKTYEVDAPDPKTAWSYASYSASQPSPSSANAPNVMDANQYRAALEKRNQESPSRSISDAALDAGITLLKGAIGLPESFVGLADIPTGGAVGKVLEEAGFRPREAKQILDTYLSEAQQAANRKVQEAQGFGPTIATALQNPSTILTGVGESLPQMIGGAGIARGILKAAPSVGAAVAGGLGEGILGAGSAAEQTRGETKDKLLTAAQSLAALGSGVGTAAFGVAGGRLANKLGFDDIDTLLAGGASKGASKSVGDFAKRAIGSGISEGVFEEMPQSAQEQMWANYATDKPLMQGVAEAAGMGAVTGFAMGVGGGGAGHLTGRMQQKRQEELDKQVAEQIAQTAQTAQAPVAKPVEEAPAVQPTLLTPATVPVEDVNAPAQDREAMLRELEDQLATIEGNAPVAPEVAPIAPAKTPEVEHVPPEVTAAEAPKEELDPQERLRRANVSMFNATRMLSDGQITQAQYDDLQRQYDLIKAKAAQFVKPNQNFTPAVAPKGDYKETKSLDTFFANYKEDKKRLDELKKYGQPEVKQVIGELNQAIQKVTDAINAKGYSANAVKHQVPADVRPLFDQFSTLTGGGSRLLMESERVGNNKKLANPEKLAKAIEESKADVANTYKFLGVEPGVAPVAPVTNAATRTKLNKATTEAYKKFDKAVEEYNKIHANYQKNKTDENLRKLYEASIKHNELNIAYDEVALNEAQYQHSIGYLNDSQFETFTENTKNSTNSYKKNIAVANKELEELSKKPNVEKAKPKTALEKASPLRIAAYNKNPFRTFLASKGLYHEKGKPKSQMIEFNAGKQILVSGYGPIFKKSGMLPDDLVVYAIQDGYLPQDATESDLVNLIELAISGKKVEPVYSEQAQEDMAAKYAERAAQEGEDYEERAGQTDAEWYGMSEQEYMDQMSQELAATNNEDFKALDDAINELMDTPASTMSARAAMEALGFSEQEIQDEERRTTAKTGEAVPTEKAPVPAESKAPAELELKQQTTEELKTKQAEIDRLEKENARLEKEAEAKAKADAERGEFVLTGSNRPADEAAARGQKDIFAAEEEKPAKQKPKAKEPAEEPSYEVNTPDGNTLTYPAAYGLVNTGYKVLALNDPRTYTDKGGNQHRTFEKDGVRLALSPQQVLFEHKDRVQLGRGNNEDLTIEVILVDPEARGQGKASRALKDLVDIADKNGLVLFAEPTPLRDKKTNQAGLNFDELVALYKKFGFDFPVYYNGPSTKVMERAPEEINKISGAIGNIEDLAKHYNGDIVYSNGDLGLVRAHGASTGEPIYVPYVKDTMYRNDIEQFPAKSFGLKDSEYRELVKVKQEFEAKAAEQHAKKPFLTIEPGVTSSTGISGRVSAVAKNWAKIFKLDGNIHIMTAEEALANKDKFTGPHRAIGYMGFLNEPGTVKKVGPNDYIVIVRKSTSAGKMLEVIAHEFGHIHQKQTYENASVETKNALIKEFNAWFKTARGGTAKELVESMRAKRTGRATQGELNIPANKMANQQYWFSFSEWYADQVSRWATTSEKPVSVVEKFFAKLGAAIKKFFAQAKAAKFLPNETFAQYLDTVTSNVDFTPTTTLVAEDQLPLFAKGTVEGAPPTDYRNFKGDEMAPAEWDNLQDSKLDDFQYKIVDKQIDTKRVIENIKKAVGEISDKFNAYIKEELYHGRTAKGIKDFLQKELLPITKDMKDANVTIDDLDQYLHNRHAEEYNEHINKINPNPKLQNKGSGISTEAAKKYLEDLPADRKAVFEKLAKQIDSIVRGTQDMLVQTGIEKKETIQAWRKAFPFYVPLKRDELEYVTKGGGVGAGLGSRGGFSKRATGSLKSVVDIFENIALQREQAIMKSEKARVGRALYGLAIQNPNTKFWLPINPDAIKNKDKLAAELEDLGLNPDDAENIAKEPVTASFDKKTGMVKYVVNPLLRNSDNVFPIRINGEDRFIIFNSSDPRAKRMVESLKNLDAEQMGLAMGTIGEVTRFMASVNTQYNPVFGAWNFARDVQGAALNLTTTDIAGHEKEVLKGVFPALRSIYSDLRAQRAGKEPKGEWQELFERFQKAGGTTGYKEQFSRGNDKAGIVARELEKLDRSNVRKTADAVFNWLSDYNDAMENAVRLSAFKVALDQGLNEDKAASLAKNLTVNFNRKGAASPTLQALYAFFNASVQGTKRLAETLQGPAGRKIMAGGFTLGVIQAIALSMAGFDDDEPPQFLKDKNLILPMGGGDYLVIPMPMGFNIFPGIGRLTTEYILGQAGAITGAKGLGDKVLDVTSLVLDSFNPLGSGSLLQILSPTAFDPLAAIQSNKDAFGRPISKEDRATSPTPGFMRSREGASWFSKNLAEFLNYVSSPAGTSYTKGKISPTADQLDYLIGQYTGGVGREVMKTGEYLGAAAKGETSELPSYRVPIAGKLYGETTTPAAISAKFYANVTELAQHENEIKQRMKNKEDTREYRAEHPEVRFINRANYLENQITQLNKQKKLLQEKDAPEERIKKIDEQKTRLMQGLNDQIKRLQQ